MVKRKSGAREICLLINPGISATRQSLTLIGLRSEDMLKDRRQQTDLLIPKAIRTSAAAVNIQPGWKPRVPQNVTESAKQVEAANEYAGGEPHHRRYPQRRLHRANAGGSRRAPATGDASDGFHVLGHI
jgi:hypothetical protein